MAKVYEFQRCEAGSTTTSVSLIRSWQRLFANNLNLEIRLSAEITILTSQHNSIRTALDKNTSRRSMTYSRCILRPYSEYTPLSLLSPCLLLDLGRETDLTEQRASQIS